MRKAFGGLIAAAASLLLGMPVSGGQVELKLSFPKGLAHSLIAYKATVTAELLGSPPDTAITKTVDVPGTIALDLADGAWNVRAAAPAYFEDSRIINVSRSTPLEIELTPVPKGGITGRLTVAGKSPMPATLQLRWKSDRDRERAEGLAACTVLEDRFHCDAPAGVFDLRLRAKGHLTHFRWNVRIAPGGTIDVGVLKLVPGASVVGFVRGGPGIKLDVKRAWARLSPVSTAQPVEGAAIRVPVSNAKGFFEFRGVSPGEYFVEAGQDTARSERRRVTVTRDAESEMLEPLAISPPSTLHVRVFPPTDPDGKAWRLRISRTVAGGSSLSTLAEAFTDDLGEYRWPGVIPGQHTIRVQANSGSTFVQRSVDADGGPLDLEIRVPLTRVDGTVKLGDTPISCKVRIGGRGRPIGVVLSSDEAGHFEGTVPFSPGEAWTVTLEGDLPPINRTVTIASTKANDDGVVNLDIDLPSSHLIGNVVDEDGRAVKGIVNLQSPDAIEGTIQTRTSQDGSFELLAVAAGRYSVEAWAFDDRRSDSIDVQIAEDESRSVRLVVTGDLQVSGRVFSAGGPVPGVNVLGLPTDRDVVISVPATSDSTGVFRFAVPKGSREVDLFVAPPGFSFRMMHIKLTGEEILVPLTQTGGTLEVETPEFKEDLNATQGFLVSNGAVTPILRFLYARDARVRPARSEGWNRVHIPLMEPGLYTFCLATYRDQRSMRSGAVPRDRCVSGTLAPFGALSLAIPHPDH